MKNMTLQRAAEVCGAKLCAVAADLNLNTELGRIVIDSRAVTGGDLFVAFKGEKVDGHNYIAAAFNKGAACCLAERIPEGETRPILLVDDVQTAIEKIAAVYRDTLNIPIIGITGSVGKTSAKEMVSAVLSAKYSVLKTEGNLNNQIGVPMTISRINSEFGIRNSELKHDTAVVEMGISGFGEMTQLAKMVRPDIAVFTVIGHAHLEYLHDLDGVLKAKTEMLDCMSPDGLVIMNGDDEKLRNYVCKQRRLLYGLSEGCDVKAENIIMPDANHTECDISYKDRRVHAVVPAYGQHMVYAALEGAAVGFEMGLSDEEIISGIANYETVGRRGAVTDTGFVTLIDDCYNANPDSVKCGIDSLAKLPGRRVCILSDMLEQGERSPEMHREIGDYAREKGIELLITTGELSRNMNALHFETNADIIAALPRLIRKGDHILVKASRGMHLEEVSEAIKALKDPRPIVMLDLDDTILDFHKAEHTALKKALKQVGIEPTQEIMDAYSVFNIRCWEALERGELDREQVKVHRYEMLFDSIGATASAKETTEIYEELLCCGHWFMPGAEELIKRLYGDYRLFIVSNGTARVQDGRLASAGIIPYFEGIFVSERIGENKPGKAFFDACAAKIDNYDPSNAIIVGDSLTSDILGGKNAGIKTCWYNFKGKKAEKIVPDYTISALDELPALLKGVFGGGY